METVSCLFISFLQYVALLCLPVSVYSIPFSLNTQSSLSQRIARVLQPFGSIRSYMSMVHRVGLSGHCPMQCSKVYFTSGAVKTFSKAPSNHTVNRPAGIQTTSMFVGLRLPVMTQEAWISSCVTLLHSKILIKPRPVQLFGAPWHLFPSCCWQVFDAGSCGY